MLLVLDYFVTTCGNLWDAILRNAGGCGTPHPPSALNFPRTMWDSGAGCRGGGSTQWGQMIRYCCNKISNIQMIEAGALFLTLPNLFHPNQFNKAILWIEEMIYLKRLFKSHSLILSALWSNCLKFYELKSLTILSPLIMTALIVDMRCWPAWKLDNKIIRCSLHLPLLPAPVNEWNQPQKITSEILKSEMHSAVQDNCSWPNLKLSWNRRYGERVYIAYSRTKTRNTAW